MKKIISMILLFAMIMSVAVVVPTSAEELSPLPDATSNYASSVFIACRTIDESGNETNLALYSQNQKVIFELIAYDKNLNKLAVEGFAYSIYADGNGDTAVQTGFAKADPVTGIALVETTTMDQPGYLRITADIADAQGKFIRAYRTAYSVPLLQGGVLVDAQSITTTAETIPADELRQFWDEQLELQVVPTIKKITKYENEKEGYETYAVYIDSIGNPDDITRPDGLADDAVGPQSGETWVAAYLTVPTTRPKNSTDLIVKYGSYGVRTDGPSYNAGSVVLTVCAHSLEMTKGTDVSSFSSYYTSWVQGGGSYGFDKNGLMTNSAVETCYFRNMLLRDVNAILFALDAFGEKGATIHPDYDETAPRTMSRADLEADMAKWKGLLKSPEKRGVWLYGGSQGGFQTVGVAAILSDIVNYCKTEITWLADCRGGEAPQYKIPATSSKANPTIAEGETRSALEYCDSANLAQLIKCKTEVATAGMGDTTSPASSIMAMYNNLTRNKADTDGPFSIVFVQSRPHSYGASYNSTVTGFLSSYSKVSFTGSLEAKVNSWSIEGKTLTINATGSLVDATGDELWEADPNFAQVDTIVLSEGIVSLGYKTFDLAAQSVTVRMPESLTSIASGAFGADADLTKFTIRSYADSYAQAYALSNGAAFVAIGAGLTPLPNATSDYSSGVFVAIRTVDEDGNQTDPIDYEKGEKVIFELAAYDSSFNRLAVDTFTYSLYDDAHGNTAFETSYVTADSETGVGLVEIDAMDQPGMLRITADIGDAQGNLLRAYRPAYSTVMAQGAALIDAGNITTVMDEPEDFDEFWDDTLKMLHEEYPAELVGLREVEAQSGYKAYEVYINCYGLESDTKSGDTFTAGYLTVPVGAAAGSLKIRATYQGQGLASLEPKYLSGYISFNCLAHSVDLTALAEYEAANPGVSKGVKYKQFLNLAEDDKAVWGEDTYGMSPTVNADREKVYYRHMLLRDYQAIEFMINYFSSEGVENEYNGIDISAWKGLWNGIDVQVSGGSQGGYQAIGVAALHDAVTYVQASIPAFCDMGAGTTKAPVGTCVGSSNRPAYAAGLDYVDGAFLAKRVNCRVDVEAGLGDPTCPPSSVMAMYNNLTKGKSEQDGPYTLKFVQNMAHGFTTYSSTTNSFLKTYSVANVDGAFGTDAYHYFVEGSVLNIVSDNDLAILKVNDELLALAIANAEVIKTIEIEGKFEYIASLKTLLKNLVRVETIKIDARTTAIAEGATEVFASAANLASLGHVEFDESGMSVAGSGNFKRDVVNLSGFDAICDGILAGDRMVKAVVLSDVTIPAKAFSGAVSLEKITIVSAFVAKISADAFEGCKSITLIVSTQAEKAMIEEAVSAFENLTIQVGDFEDNSSSSLDKSGSAGANAIWKIKGATLTISGSGSVTGLKNFAAEDKAIINNVVVSAGITAINSGIFMGFELDRVTFKGTTLPAAGEGVFGEQSADFAIHVSPGTNVEGTLYGYNVKVDGGTAGDLNGDGDINAKDAVLLAQVLANWDVKYNENAADCNSDGGVNAKDAVLLAQYLANWDVQLGVITGDGDVEIPGGDLLDD